MNAARLLAALLFFQPLLACRGSRPLHEEPGSVRAPPAAPAPETSAQVAPDGTAGGAPNRWLTAKDCTEYDKSPEYRDWTETERASSRLNCELIEELRVFVVERQRCVTAADCTTVTGSCPFGCFIPVSSSSAPAVTAKLEELRTRQEAAGARCMYRCMPSGAPSCVSGRCTE